MKLRYFCALFFCIALALRVIADMVNPTQCVNPTPQDLVGVYLTIVIFAFIFCAAGYSLGQSDAEDNSDD